MPSLMVSKYEENMFTFLEGYRAPLHPRLLQHHRIKDMLARLHPSRIPQHPLNKSGAQAITEAIQAWRVFNHLCIAVLQSGRSYVNALLPSFADAWQWFLFLLPGEGNIKDLPGLDMDSVDFPLRSDGTVAITVHLRMRLLSTTLSALLDIPVARAACLTRLRFGEVFLSVLTHNWPDTDEEDLRLYDLISAFRVWLASKDVRLLAEMAAHEDRQPGAILRAMFQRMEMMQGVSGSSTESWDHFMDYGTSVPHLVAFRPVLNGFRHASGVSLLVKVLLRSVPKAAMTEDELENVTEGQHLIVRLAMSIMDTLFASREHEHEVVEAIRAGILTYIDSILHFVPETGRTGKAWHENAERWVRNVLMPAMVWPDVLRACMKQTGFCKRLADPPSTMKLTWNALAGRFVVICPRYQSFVSRIRALQRDGCSNPDCRTARPQGGKLKMCTCATVFYCSRECQTAHWRSGHKRECPQVPRHARIIGIHQILPGRSRPPTQAAPVLDYMEYHFIKECAFHEYNRWIEQGSASDGRIFMVEFEDSTDASLKTTVSAIPAEGMIRLRVRVRWGGSLDVEMDIGDNYLSIEPL